MPAAGAPAGGALAVDARALHGSGIGRYLRELLPRVAAAGAFERVFLLGDDSELLPFVADAGITTTSVRLAGGRYSVRSQLAWAGAVRQVPRGATFWFPHWDAPVALPARSVVTVHDLIHLRVPGSAPAWKRAAMRALLRRTVRRAARLITVSRHTADDLAREFRGAHAPVTVIPNGVDARFSNRAPVAAPVAGPYVLTVGNRKPHKAHEVALAAFIALAAEDAALRWVVAGEEFPHWRKVLALAELAGVRGRIVDVGVASDAQLAALYAGAAAVLQPSRYEGFGLAVLEAMAAGAPVVAANATSVPEVAGDAALLVPPGDAAAMAAAVRRVRTDASLRARLAAAGRARAAEFTWERSAAATVRVLREAE